MQGWHLGLLNNNSVFLSILFSKNVFSIIIHLFLELPPSIKVWIWKGIGFLKTFNRVVAFYLIAWGMISSSQHFAWCLLSFKLSLNRQTSLWFIILPLFWHSDSLPFHTRPILSYFLCLYPWRDYLFRLPSFIIEASNEEVVHQVVSSFIANLFCSWTIYQPILINIVVDYISIFLLWILLPETVVLLKPSNLLASKLQLHLLYVFFLLHFLFM